MRALRFDDQLHLTTTEPSPSPNATEALIHVRLAGICHTDLELTRGYMGFRGILGHEFVGEIVQGNADWPVGTRVVGEINVACGCCAYCGAAIPSQCRNRSTLGIANYDGAFADLIRLPFANLYRVPDSITDEQAVFTEPLAAALQVPALTLVRPSDRVVLIGAGKLGLLIAQVLQRLGCDLTVIVRRERPKQLLRQWGIATLNLDAADSLRQSAHIVVDSTGNAEGFEAALNIVRPRGTIVLKSTYAELPRVNLSKVVVDEIKVVGSRCGPFDAALRMLEQHIDVTSLIEQVYPLDDALPAFDHAAQAGVLKVLLKV
jgi:threonine dehydrogenase-like Zn-dependent dehydrogenase